MEERFSSLIMPKLFQLVLFKNIIFFYVNQSNRPLILTYLGGCFIPLNRLLAGKKKYVSLSFWSPTTYIKITKIGGGHLGYFPCEYILTDSNFQKNVFDFYSNVTNSKQINNFFEIIKKQFKNNRFFCY